MGLMHNSKASSIKGRFINGSSVTVYIEGPDDKNFWYRRFEKAGYKVAVVPVKGVTYLEAHKKQIYSDPTNAQFIVAQDADYSYYMSTSEVPHPRVIMTYGYSIENTMFCVPNINKIICKYAKQPDQDYTSDVSSWLNDLLTKLYEVIICDIVNMKASLGIKVLRNSARYISEEMVVNQGEIDKIKQEILDHISISDLDRVQCEIEADPRPIGSIVRGHALANPVLRYIINKVKEISGTKINFSNDNLYAETECCCCVCENCIDHAYLNDRIVAAMNTIAIS